MSSEEEYDNDGSNTSSCSGASDLPENFSSLKPYDMEPMRDALEPSLSSSSQEDSSDEEKRQ